MTVVQDQGTPDERAERLRVVYVEPFWGGSHRASAEGWTAVSRHAVAVESLPPRFWKWRLRGAAFDLARRLSPRVARGEVDLLFATDMIDLAHLKALLPRSVATLLYFHENQATYPLADGVETAERDLQYVFTNLASAMAADCVAFNSCFQKTQFVEGMTRILRRMPDARVSWCVELIEAKSLVLRLGVTLADIPDLAPRSWAEPPVILWNHRWEYDKDPETFFEVVLRLADQGIPFRLLVAGETFERAPAVFSAARERLDGRILHWGYAAARSDYVALLGKSDVVVSTAVQENFGISVV